MTRFDGANLAEANAQVLRPTWLLDVLGRHMTQHDGEVTYSGNTYQPTAFTITGLSETNTLDGHQLTITFSTADIDPKTSGYVWGDMALYMVFLNEDNEAVATSGLGWVGKVVSINASHDDEHSIVEIVGQDWLSLLGRPGGMRFTSADQKSRPGAENDTFFDNMPALKGKKVNWMGHDVGGGSGGCVVVNTWLPTVESKWSHNGKAGNVEPGDVLRGANASSLEPSTYKVMYSQTKQMDCVEITTISGVQLRCSTTAKIGTIDGWMFAPDLMGHAVAVLDEDRACFERVTEVRDIGVQWVQHISAQDGCFWAGKVKGRYILHHNKIATRPSGVAGKPF